MVLAATALPEVAPFKLYAPFSVVVLVWAPLGWPLLIQLENLALSNQLTYVIGRLPVLFITAYVYVPAVPERLIWATLVSVPMLAL